MFSAFTNVRLLISDRLFQHPDILQGNISVIGIDAKSLEEMGPFQTWSREDMAKALDVLNADPEARPAVIGVDVMYYGNTDINQDKSLVEACSRYDNIVLASSVVFQNTFEQVDENKYRQNPYTVTMVEEPFEKLKAVTMQGNINTMPDVDGVVRHHMYRVELPNGTVMESFASKLYKKYADINGIKINEPKLDENNKWYIPFTGMPGAYYDYYSFSDLLSGELTGDMFADGAVLIGAYAPGLMDSFVTSIDHSSQMYGVEIHANLLDALIRQNFKVYVPIALQLIFAITIIFLVVSLFERLRIQYILLLTFFSIGGYILLCRFLYEIGYIFDILYVPLCLGIGFIGVSLKKYISLIFDRMRIVNTFKRYLEPKVVDQLLKSGDELTGLGGKSTNISCLFIDIRGFTSMSEILSPNQVVEILNEYFELITKCIFNNGGTLDKFIGDAAMAIFNAPIAVDGYIYNSVCAAWEIVQGSQEIQHKIKLKYGQNLQFGIGIHCGEAVVGNIGTMNRMDYTAIGDTVNTAARLESIAKAGQILVSKDVYEELKDRIELESSGKVLLKGKTEEMEVFSVINIDKKIEVNNKE